MLSRVLDIVAAEGWFDTAAPFEKTIQLTHGAAHCATLSRGGRADTFVKFSELASLAAEAQRCLRAGRDFAGIAPAFVGHAARASLEVLATKAESFDAVTAISFERAGDRARLLTGLECYFARMRQAVAPAAPVASPRVPRAWFDDMTAYFAAARSTPSTLSALDLARDALPGLPPMPQHGDLVANNLGLRPDGTLVVFDWEDYGAVDLPGLDLFTLDMSLGTQAGAGGSGLPPPAVERCCAALGLVPHAYRRLAPAYALAFRYLKRNYSPEVRARVDALLERVSGASEGRAAR